jgi:hypothetical protein
VVGFVVRVKRSTTGERGWNVLAIVLDVCLTICFTACSTLA